MSAYSNKAPFDASMLVYFRERIGINLVTKINERMVEKIREAQEEKSEEKSQQRK
jgi:hypothetical protein